MFCPYCGHHNSAEATFCEKCGKALNATNQQSSLSYDQPAYVDPPVQTTVQHSMKWFKFLIYFALFAGAVINFSNGISMLTGSQYNGQADLVYATFDGLRTFDMIFGLLAMALAVFGIYTRFQLSGFRKNGPRVLVALYLAVAAYNVLYIIAAHAMLPETLVELTNFSGVYGNLASNVVMAFVNNSYLKKRADLFVN